MSIDQDIAVLRERIAEHQRVIDTCDQRRTGSCGPCDSIEHMIILWQQDLDQLLQDQVSRDNTYSLIEQQ